MTKPLSEHQLGALKRSKDGIVRVGGRGCKQTLNGIIDRGLADQARLDFSFGSGSGWWAYLTDAGKTLAKQLQQQGGDQ